MVRTRLDQKSSANGHPNGFANGNANGHLGRDYEERTDYSRWRLQDEQGRHTWHYLETDEQVKEWPQTIADKHHLGLETVSQLHLPPTPTNSLGPS
jgi:lanosterol synthase